MAETEVLPLGSDTSEKKYPIRQIFSDHLDEILKMPGLTDEQRSTARMIGMCRTSRLGVIASYCPECKTLSIRYPVCNNHNCPSCQHTSEKAWVAQKETEVIPGIPYYHIILTVPHQLNELIRMNPKLLLNKLFSCSANAVIDMCKDKRFLGATPGIISVLHTWQQNLLPHYHVHMIVSGGGLDPAGNFISVSGDRFFLPMKAITKLFRQKMMDAVRRLWKRNLLTVPQNCCYSNADGWHSFCDSLYKIKWVGKIVKTFNGNGNAIEYLGRYVFRTAISNNRIRDYDGKTVTFSVTNRKTGIKQNISLPAMEFIRRFLSHVLPKSFCRVRYYGFLSNSKKNANLVMIHRQRKLSEYSPSPLRGANKQQLFMILWGVDISVCSCCGTKLIVLPRASP